MFFLLAFTFVTNFIQNWSTITRICSVGRHPRVNSYGKLFGNHQFYFDKSG